MVSLVLQVNPDCEVFVVLLRSTLKPSVDSRHWSITSQQRKNLFINLFILSISYYFSVCSRFIPRGSGVVPPLRSESMNLW